MALYSYFLSRVKRNLHVVLAMSPIGDAFRTRLRQFPSLINCCTIGECVSKMMRVKIQESTARGHPPIRPFIRHAIRFPMRDLADCSIVLLFVSCPRRLVYCLACGCVADGGRNLPGSSRFGSSRQRRMRHHVSALS